MKTLLLKYIRRNMKITNDYGEDVMFNTDGSFHVGDYDGMFLWIGTALNFQHAKIKAHWLYKLRNKTK